MAKKIKKPKKVLPRNKVSHRWKVYYRNQRLARESEAVEGKDNQSKRIVFGFLLSLPLAFLVYVATIVVDWFFRQWGIK